ncbi:MAG: hypothetical protein DRG78_20170 [Epsilonproteobacteria bacterium]|nr:MAG: hypothetical protein DRG78_20170 [Campylobacterota bacterium]
MSDFDNKIMELKRFYKVKTHRELADILGVSVHTINTWKQRKSLPKKIELILSQNELKTGTPILPDNIEEILKSALESIDVHNMYKKEKELEKKKTLHVNFPKELENHLSEKEVEILEAYRTLSKRKQDMYYHKILADALEDENDDRLKAV